MRCIQLKHLLAAVSVLAVAWVLCSSVAQAQQGDAGASLTQLRGTSQDEAAPTQGGRPFVDGIAAVVNRNVITLRQLDLETRSAQAQLQRQNIPVPDGQTLQKQVLQRMISEELERQEAERLNIHVDDEQVNDAVQTIAQRNELSVDALRQEILASGVPWDVYLKDLKQDIQLDMLRQRMIDHTIVITDAEVDAFLRTEGGRMGTAAPAQGAPAGPAADAPAPQPVAQGPQVLGLAHILVAVPEGASSSQVAELRQKAEAILARVRGGADFAGVAASSSDGPQALDGGDMGVRPVEGWPDLFVEATRGLSEGDISDVFQSGNGFHILKVVVAGQAGPDRDAAASRGIEPRMPTEQAAQAGQPAGPMMVTQTHARHILIKTSQVMSDDQARQRLEQLRQRLIHGEDFADLAKRHSEDTSAPLGGDLGWLTPGETVPAFEQAMNELQPGDISPPVQSQFGWHLIQVLDRRSKDMEDEFRRMQARQILFQRRVEPALDDWLSQLRGEAYIENRLDPQSSRRRR